MKELCFVIVICKIFGKSESLPKCKGRSKEVIDLKVLSLCLVIFLLLLLGAVGTVSAQDGDWEKGENRLENGDFEMDSKGSIPTRWTLEDGT
jgi:hypothetical protein